MNKLHSYSKANIDESFIIACEWEKSVYNEYAASEDYLLILFLD